MSLDDDYDDEVTAFYRKYLGKVQGYLINMGTDHGLAEEIADDAFLGARRYWAHVRSLDRPEAYIFKIAKNERGKRQRRFDSHAADLRPEPPEPRQHDAGDLAEGVADRTVVREALQRLPPRLREVIALRDVEDLALDTTAEIMGISAGAVKRYAFEGRQRLRVLLPEFGGAGEEGIER